MKCSNIQDWLLEIALGTRPVPPEIRAHLSSCRKCNDTLQALRSTMNLLDEWTAPEPSPFWDIRMQVRLREEQQRASAGCLQLFRRPVLSIAAALCLVGGIGFYQVDRFLQEGNRPIPTALHITAPAGTAVGDLQCLDKYSDLLQNFDALNDIDGQASSTN